MRSSRAHAAQIGTELGARRRLLYLASVATRTLLLDRNVVVFEVVQTALAISAGLGGAVIVATRAGIGAAGFAIGSTFGAALRGGVRVHRAETRQESELLPVHVRCAREHRMGARRQREDPPREGDRQGARRGAVFVPRGVPESRRGPGLERSLTGESGSPGNVNLPRWDSKLAVRTPDPDPRSRSAHEPLGKRQT
jgi:hypothetical protein